MGMIVAGAILAQSGPHPGVGALPEPRQLPWHEMRGYAFVHFGPNTFTDREWGHGDEPGSVFNPTEFDASQWVSAFKEAGFEGVILTAKHHDGFCLWPSAQSTHTVAASPWRNGRGDVLRALSGACADAGLKFGVYLSPWDRNHPAYGTGDGYNEVFRAQLREVLTSYGPTFEVWFDGACGEGPNGKRQVYDFPGFRAVVRELQPGAVMFSDVGPDCRWVGNESGHAGETNWATLNVTGFGIGNDHPPTAESLRHGDRQGERWVPAECDVSIRPGWFWHEHENGKVKSPRVLFDLFERSWGHNGSFLLNVPPDRRGRIHDNDVAALRGFRELVDATYDQNLAQGALVAASSSDAASSPAACLVDDSEGASPDDAYWIAPLEVSKATITIDWVDAVTLDRVQLREPIHIGQRIESVKVEARVAGAYREIATATTVGNRRVIRVELVETDSLRVTVSSTLGSPALRLIGVHRTPLKPTPGSGAP
ncbi:MAG: alpha-L-fucosidase [Planctomycetota bacterium]|nr:alpha-L-fucosidase [Planctomycetota bacterium]MDA1106199.1 alpha-L-fucosidase [Planctomycetota bacterium]